MKHLPLSVVSAIRAGGNAHIPAATNIKVGPGTLYRGSTRPTDVHALAMDMADLDTRVARGVTAAKALISDPGPFKIDSTVLQRMLDSVAAAFVHMETEGGESIAIDAEHWELLENCYKADRHRRYLRGEPEAVVAVIAERASLHMYEFSERRHAEQVAKRLEARGPSVTVTGGA